MTDTPPVPPTPDNPPAPAGYSPAAPGPKQALSLTGFILGLAGFVFSWIPVLGFLVSVAAVIVSLVARTKEPGAPKWMWIVGVIGGALGVLGSIVWTLLWLIPTIALSTYSYY
jgi:hypothetical protein